MEHVRSGDAHSVVLVEVVMQPAFFVFVISTGNNIAMERLSSGCLNRIRHARRLPYQGQKPKTWAFLRSYSTTSRSGIFTPWCQEVSAAAVSLR